MLLYFRYNNSNTKVILYQVTNGLLLGKSVSFQYKATTVGNLQPSVYISSPVFLSYATLPPSLSPREGRKFEQNSDQVRSLFKKMLLLRNSYWIMLWLVAIMIEVEVIFYQLESKACLFLTILSSLIWRELDVVWKKLHAKKWSFAWAKKKKPETKREESGGDIFRLSRTCSQKSKPLKIEFPSRYFQ